MNTLSDEFHGEDADGPDPIRKKSKQAFVEELVENAIASGAIYPDGTVKTVYVDCPFCREYDFDLIGLKNHFQKGHCDKFNETPLL